MEIITTKIVANSAKRKGRGIGSGKGGHTVGFGQKGQGSRGKRKVQAMSEGGNIPLPRKLPVQKGYKSLNQRAKTVTIPWLNAHTKDNQTVDISFFVTIGIIDKPTDKVKIVGKDVVAHKLNIKNIPISSGAKKAIEDKGGTVVN